MRYEVRSIGLWSFVKISFFLNLALGFLFGLILAPLFSVWLSMVRQLGMPGQMPAELPDASPAFFLIFIPIMMAFFMAVFHTIAGAVGVLLYNLAARLMGGLEMTLNPVESPPAAPASYDSASAARLGVPPPPPHYPTSTPAERPMTPLNKPEPPASQFE